MTNNMLIKFLDHDIIQMWFLQRLKRSMATNTTISQEGWSNKKNKNVQSGIVQTIKNKQHSGKGNKNASIHQQ